MAATKYRIKKMADGVYFVIERTAIGIQGVKYHDGLPANSTARRIYSVRLDTLPHADFWMQRSIGQLMQAYAKSAAAGMLPASGGSR
jgi:hypothetical protein